MFAIIRIRVFLRTASRLRDTVTMRLFACGLGLGATVCRSLACNGEAKAAGFPELEASHLGQDVRQIGKDASAAKSGTPEDDLPIQRLAPATRSAFAQFSVRTRGYHRVVKSVSC